MWRINLITNTVKITEDCAKDLFEVSSGDGEPWYRVDDIIRDDKLVFYDDHFEWMDYLRSNDHASKFIEVLCKHKVNGYITFCDMEGDQKGFFWGHRFVDGVYTPIVGELIWKNDTNT